MSINFWDDHTIFFFLAMILIPRLSMVWFGMINPLSVVAIAEWSFIPRINMAIIFSGAYYDYNPKTIIAFWIIAVVGDIIDFWIKFKQMRKTYKAQQAVMMQKYPNLFRNHYWTNWRFYVLKSRGCICIPDFFQKKI